MSSTSLRMLSCSHSATSGEPVATLSLGCIAPTTRDGSAPLPREYHMNLTRGQVDSITLGLQRVAQQLGAEGEGE